MNEAQKLLTQQPLPLVDYKEAGEDLLVNTMKAQHMIGVLITHASNQEAQDILMYIGNHMAEGLVNYCEATGTEYECSEIGISREAQEGTEQDEGASEEPSGPDLWEQTGTDAKPF